jgi:hypothetical protein
MRFTPACKRCIALLWRNICTLTSGGTMGDVFLDDSTYLATM